jgi:hypothetical protein
MFQPVPNQVFGVHWGMSLEDVEKVRSLELLEEFGKFKVYTDKTFTLQELPGIMSVTYLFMNDRLGGAFMRLHCESETQLFASVFSVMHGQPTSFDQDLAIAEWEGGGNVVQLVLTANVLIMGNGKIIKMANNAFDDHAKKNPPQNKEDPSVVIPGPKTES